MNLNRIALGTVQFGKPYGIANQSGQVDKEEIAAILQYASMNHMDTLDTAMAYGESEQRLGSVGVSEWNVITKLPAIPEHCDDITAFVQASIIGSLQRLNVNVLYGLLLHAPKQLLDTRGDLLYRALTQLKKERIVAKIGISIYTPDELDNLLPYYDFDLVQAPFNILDRRLMTTGWMQRLKEANIELHVRSIFLQGLLLMNKQNRPAKFKPWQSLWHRWDSWLEEEALTPLEACLNFALSQPAIHRIVVGLDSLNHLKEIQASEQRSCLAIPSELISNDLNLINPSCWTTL
jgi:aryl-alcohol dehydrogenase-like predicted oxidoreductase